MSATLATTATISPAQFAERYGIGLKKVLAWLDSGELSAVNVGTGKTKPRWRIRQIDIERFEARRANSPTPRLNRRRRTMEESRPAGWVDFFAES
jgi:hypothetical protein